MFEIANCSKAEDACILKCRMNSKREILRYKIEVPLLRDIFKENDEFSRSLVSISGQNSTVSKIHVYFNFGLAILVLFSSLKCPKHSQTYFLDTFPFSYF